jgi:chromate transporter
MTITMAGADWLSLFIHYLSLSLLSVGGAITTAPDMHRYLVDQQGWLTDPQFSASIAIAQAAPGPNVLFVALLGWNVGLNAGGLPTACSAWPSRWSASCSPAPPSPTSLPDGATRTASCARCAPSSKAWRPSSSPCWSPPAGFLPPAAKYSLSDWPIWAVAVVTTIVVWRTRGASALAAGSGRSAGLDGLGVSRRRHLAPRTMSR